MTGVICLAVMAVHPRSVGWLGVWGGGAALAFLSAAFGVTARGLRWLLDDYPRHLRAILVLGALMRKP